MRLIGLAVTLVLNLLVATSAAEGQPAPQVYRIAVVSPTLTVSEMTEAKNPSMRALFSELRRLGYIEGQNLVVGRWFGGGRRENYPGVAQEIVRFGPHAILAGSGRLAQALQALTTITPIVTTTTDPIGLGLTTSLARPSGNVTGFSLDAGTRSSASGLSC